MAAIELKLSGLDGVLETLQSLPAELVSRRGGVVLAALRAGALVILEQEKANLAAVTANATESGKIESTGLLLNSLIVSRGKAPSDGNGERYLVRVKKSFYRRKGLKVNTRVSAQLLEYGSEKQPAEPWIRPAVASKGQEAIQTIERELLAGIERAVAKLSKGS